MSTALTVVIPARNAAGTLGDTLASLVGADRLAGVVVVDDGSTDGTAALARDHGRRLSLPLRVITSHPSLQLPTGAHRTAEPGPARPAGPAGARNLGASYARTVGWGDVFAFLDADDLWCGGRPDPRWGPIDAGASVSVGRSRCVDRSGAEVGEPFDAFLNGAAFITAACFDAVGGFDASLDGGEELEWYLRATDAGAHVAWIDDVVLHYRLRPGSVSAGPSARSHGLLTALHRTIQRRSEAVDAVDGLEAARP